MLSQTNSDQNKDHLHTMPQNCGLGIYKLIYMIKLSQGFLFYLHWTEKFVTPPFGLRFSPFLSALLFGPACLALRLRARPTFNGDRCKRSLESE